MYSPSHTTPSCTPLLLYIFEDESAAAADYKTPLRIYYDDDFRRLNTTYATAVCFPSSWPVVAQFFSRLSRPRLTLFSVSLYLTLSPPLSLYLSHSFSVCPCPIVAAGGSVRWSAEDESKRPDPFFFFWSPGTVLKIKKKF